MRTILEPASSSALTELQELHERNKESHAPWVMHGDIAAYFVSISNGTRLGYFVRHAETGDLIAVVNLNEPVRKGFLSAYLGYYLDSRYGGQGLMREGLALVLEESFGPLGFHRLEANIQPGNSRSINLVKNLGFRMEGFSPRYLHIGGQWCDHERWAILADEWQALRGAVLGVG